MKILVLTNNGAGLYKFRRELLEKLILLNNEVFVSFPNDEYTLRIKKIGCKYIDSNVDRRGKSPVNDIRLMIHYIKIITNVKPDVVLTYTVKPNIYGGIACRIAKKTHIANITGLGTSLENKGLTQKLVILLYKIGLNRTRCIFFQNKSNLDFFVRRNIIKNEMRLIPGSGVNLVQNNFEEYPEDKENIKFLYIGRIMKDKGIDELLNAASIIKKKYIKVQFNLIGFCEENYAAKLEELTQLGIINYYGRQDDVHEFIKNSHATILPSYYEGTSNALLESASTGRPVLASNIAGCVETFDEGITGFGFAVKNVESLVETIIKFINLPYEKKKEMGIAARVKMEKEFDRNIVVNAYLEQISK